MITREMTKEECNVSEYLVRQMLKRMGYRHWSFIKDLPMKDVKDRNAQFLNIADIREKASAIGLPIISIDAKKKEFIGNFKRDGKVLALGSRNPLTTISGHSPMVSDCPSRNLRCDKECWIHDDRHESRYLQIYLRQYRKGMESAPAGTVSCRKYHSRTVRWRRFQLQLPSHCQTRPYGSCFQLDMNLLVMHYPPYCSKYNPIEHRLFSQITRSWSGAPLLSLEDAARRAAETTTSKRLTVYVDINNKTYDIQRSIDESYDDALKKRVVFQTVLSKWNYLVKKS